MVSFDELRECDVIMVRAMDESLVLQQRDMYWNPTGMMKYTWYHDHDIVSNILFSNWWFRVAVHRYEENGKLKLRFEHPTLAGTASGGWMEVRRSMQICLVL